MKEIHASVFEMGDFHDAPDVTRIFTTKEGAMAKIPTGFELVEDGYYENDITEQWLTIKTYRVEA